jgi:hypothetical protein
MVHDVNIIFEEIFDLRRNPVELSIHLCVKIELEILFCS